MIYHDCDVKRNKLDNLVSDFSRLYILTILYENPAHGYEIMTKFKERVGRNLSPGLIYPFLQTLEERGIISYETEMIGEKERKIFHLTEKGVEFTNTNFRRFARIIATALEPSLDLCAHCGCKVYEGAHTEEIDGKEMVFCCVHCASNYMKSYEEQKRSTPTQTLSS
jgi:DNA-binding PadR family transcriptional regulator